MKKHAIGIGLLALTLLVFSGCPLGNSLLIANAGPAQTVMSVTSVSLNGSASTGSSLSYSWEQTGGTTVTISGASTTSPTFTAPGLTPGISEVLTFTLTVSDGNEISTDTVDITVLTWEQVSAGFWHTIALRSDGTIWAWGTNFNGEIGQGNANGNDYKDVITQVGTDTDWEAVSAGEYHNLALKSGGTIYAWGDNDFGQLGNGSDGTDVSTPEQVGSAANWVKIETGEEQSFAIDNSDNIYGWGNHNLDRLGVGAVTGLYTAPTLIRTGSVVSSGGISALAIDGSTLWGWGNNAYGQLAIPSSAFGSTNVPNSTNGMSDVVAVATGGQHSYIIRNDVYGSGNDTLWSMGINSNGQLGTGAATDSDPGVITATGVSSWNAVAAGKNHGLAVGSNGTLWSWGDNNRGLLGLGDSGAATDRAAPEQVGTGTDWYNVSAWINHSAGLKSDGTLWTWGWASYGAIGDPTASSPVESPLRVGY